MSCFSCSRNTLSLFIRSIYPEYPCPTIRPHLPYALPKHRSFSVTPSLRNDKLVSEDLQTPSAHSTTTDHISEAAASRKERRKLKEVSPPVNGPERPRTKKEQWQIQKAALKEKFGDQPWQPRKKLSPDAMEGIRHLHMSQPEKFTTPVLAEHFKVSPEAIRRILKSKWRPSDKEEDERLKRWDKRGERIWSNLVEMGVKPPKKWREMGVGRARLGEVPQWKSRWKNRVPVNDSTSNDIIPIVNQVSEESTLTPRWQRTPIANRML